MRRRPLEQRIVLTAAAAWLAVAVYTTSDADAGFMAVGLFLTGGLIGVAWLVCLAPELGRGEPISRRLRDVPWMCVPLLPVAAIFLADTRWPMAVRLWLCEPTMRAYMESPRYPRGWSEPERVGYFDVIWVDRDGPAIYATTATGFITKGGIIYAPEGPPPHQPERYARHVHRLYGPWYRFYDAD